jgi:hypothetical protein
MAPSRGSGTGDTVEMEAKPVRLAALLALKVKALTNRM